MSVLHDIATACFREKLYSWLMSMKKPDGSFAMHKGGEVDVRYALRTSRIPEIIFSGLVT